MALRDVSLSDTTCDDRASETHRKLIGARERIEDLEGALRGLIGLVQLISHNRDLPAAFRETLMTNHRVLDAEELLR